MTLPVYDAQLDSYVIIGPDGWPVYGATAGDCEQAYADHVDRLRKNPDADLWRAKLAEESAHARAWREQSADLRRGW